MEKAQEIIDEIGYQERRKAIFDKINPETLRKYSAMGIEIITE